jgi:hypothetical protein
MPYHPPAQTPTPQDGLPFGQVRQLSGAQASGIFAYYHPTLRRVYVGKTGKSHQAELQQKASWHRGMFGGWAREAPAHIRPSSLVCQDARTYPPDDFRCVVLDSRPELQNNPVALHLAEVYWINALPTMWRFASYNVTHRTRM